MRVIL
jgi:hypothetical protein